MFRTPPRAVCFQSACNRFFTWLSQHQRHSEVTDTVGDLALTPEGLVAGHVLENTTSHVSKLGICIMTGREKTTCLWEATSIAKQLQESFPNLRLIAVHLEVSCVCDPAHQAAIMDLLRMLRCANIKVLTYEVFLIHLRGGNKFRTTKLRELKEQLQSAGVTIMKEPRTRTTKEIPSDGFAIPASLALSTPELVAEEVSEAIWKSVW